MRYIFDNFVITNRIKIKNNIYSAITTVGVIYVFASVEHED